MTADADNRRDITRAIELATWIRESVLGVSYNEVEELIQLLTDLDARTGRKDPSKRTKRTTKPLPVKAKKRKPT